MGFSRKTIYVITGGPGSGKSTIIHALEKKGFLCNNEFARDIIKEQKKKGGKILPCINRLKFHELILQKRIEQYEDIPEGKICFSDRGIPDLIGYLINYGIEVPDKYYRLGKKYRYQDTVFFAPPWRELFKKDSERKETFDEAVDISDKIYDVYKDLDYNILTIPKVSVNDRVEFILSNIHQ
ncbi:MAG: AAA family ATPase [Candidatus Aenigmarchaeota archaeon]|nr:AAA family ATPase [Candidatus Aenigmarchaeota archaeon]